MISSVTREIGGTVETFKLGNRAMRSLEERFDMGIPAFVQWMQDDPKAPAITILTAILAESGSDGQGRDMEFADKVIDDLGQGGASALVNEIVEAAFSEAKDEPGKNAKRAAQRK